MIPMIPQKRAVRFAALLVPLLLASASCRKAEGPRASLLTSQDRAYAAQTLGGLREDVRVVLFSRDGGDCKYCADAEGLLTDIAAAAPRVKVEILSLKKDAARAAELAIDKVPGIAILGTRDYGLRYFGLPSGYEFTLFVETLRSVGNSDPELAPATVATLAALRKPVQLSVFVTQH